MIDNMVNEKSANNLTAPYLFYDSFFDESNSKVMENIWSYLGMNSESFR